MEEKFTTSRPSTTIREPCGPATWRNRRRRPDARKSSSAAVANASSCIRVTAADGAADDNLGRAVSLSGDGNTALVGAPYDDTPGGMNAGSAYVFVRSGTNWSQQAKLTASDGAVADSFGYAVCLSSDGATALMGAKNDITPTGVTGSAYAFVRNGTIWSQQAKLTAMDMRNNQPW